MADSKTQVQQIAPDGDVILVIGTPASAKLLVSSATLKRTSQVFAAMLSSRYREGQEAGTSESPKEIPLPDDETVAMTSMCNLLHGKRLEKTLGSDRILELAIVVDKYACAEALHYQSQATLLQWLDQVSGCQAGSYCRIAAASYLLGQACAFQRATRRLVEHTSEDNTTLMKDDCGKMLPVSVFFAIEWKRTAAYNKISTELPRLGIPVCDRCDVKNHRRGSNLINFDEEYINQLCKAFEVPHWPPDFLKLRYSVLTAIEKMRLIGSGKRQSVTCMHTGRKLEVGAKAFKTLADEVAALCTGLCLQCTKSGEVDLVSECDKVLHT